MKVALALALVLALVTGSLAACGKRPPELFVIPFEDATASDSTLVLHGVSEVDRYLVVGVEPGEPDVLSVTEFLGLWPTLTQHGSVYGASLYPDGEDLSKGYALDVATPIYSADKEALEFAFRARNIPYDVPPSDLAAGTLQLNWNPERPANELGQPSPPVRGSPTPPR